jgi:DNA primase
MLNPIDEIKERLDIVEVIGSYIKLQKAGANFRAICPFHSEKKPSFFVSPVRQIWHCFGCSRGGDIFGFVKEIEGVEFGDALRILAQKAGVELKRQPPELKTERQRLYEICELTTKFFEKQLEESKAGKEAKEYLLGRGIKEESLKKWRIGYAPDVWQGLSDFLNSRGYQKKEIEKAGLGLTSEKGSFYDRFRGRIIFPIFDLNSQIVGFTGRVFKERDKAEVAKYVNTPQTLLYDKSRILYGLDKAKVEIRKKDFCILVEGNTDAIMVSQSGFENVVATSGTALTPFQLKILKRYSDNLLTAFDMDVAGDAATKRGIDLAQTQGFNVKVITLPERMDPADFILKNPKEWEKKLKEAKSILDFYFESTFSKFDKNTPEGKREISKILLPVIKRIPNKIVQSHWVGELAKRLRVKEEDIEEELKKIKLGTLSEVYGLEPEEIENLPPKSRKELLEERLVTLILKFPANLNLIEGKCLDYFSPEIEEIFTKLKKKEEPDSQFFNYLALKAEIEEFAETSSHFTPRSPDESRSVTEEKEIRSEIEYCLKEIENLEIKNKLNQISQEIKKAEEEKDIKRIEKLTREFNLYSKSRSDLETT